MSISSMHADRAARSLQAAFRYYNRHLFGNRIPECRVDVYYENSMIYGFYQRDGTADRIAINALYIGRRTPRQILSVLVHEMCHAAQYHCGRHFGVPPVHNFEFARIMIAVGLAPSVTGRPGGAPIGPYMDHYIIQGGPFARVSARLLTPLR